MFARTVWSHLETLHAVTYFAGESVEAAKSAGLRGFWMGYFGFRAAPLGAVTPGVVEAAFANFEPAMVRRSIPDAWDFADPSDLVVARARAAGAVLRRLSPRVDDVAAHLNRDLDAVISAAPSIARPLFAANRDLDRFDDPVEQLWQHCTTLREHRGGGHVAALAAAGIDGCEAHLLLAAERGWSPAVFFDSRGWSPEQQHGATMRLVERGLLGDSDLTPTGVALRSKVEDATDVRAAEPFERALPAARRNDVLDELSRISADIVRSETIPFPNPMGLPHPDDAAI